MLTQIVSLKKEVHLMKKILILMILLIFAVTTSSWAQSDTLPNDLGKKVNTAEGLKKVIDNKDSKFVIVDVRNESAYNTGHIPTAINIPRGFISNVRNPPPKDKYIILYCYGGMTSPAAGERMLADGYKYIFVWGGIINWPFELESSK
jgi:rhodanese-related sulfurtransferase